MIGSLLFSNASMIVTPFSPKLTCLRWWTSPLKSRTRNSGPYSVRDSIIQAKINNNTSKMASDALMPLTKIWPQWLNKICFKICWRAIFNKSRSSNTLILLLKASWVTMIPELYLAKTFPKKIRSPTLWLASLKQSETKIFLTLKLIRMQMDNGKR